MEMDMSADFDDGFAARERLSALADGELDDFAVASGCAHWRDDAKARAAWHAYHLIGDVLRSDDLAAGSARDAAFLRALRLRLADEPVVLAPPLRNPGLDEVMAAASGAASGATSSAGRHGTRWRWMASSAVAAAFVAVAGVLVVTRPANAPVSPATAVASLLRADPVAAAPMTSAPVLAAIGGPAADTQALVASGDFIRDARLDRYLAAHKQFAGSSALGVPSGFLRSATVDTAQR